MKNARYLFAAKWSPSISLDQRRSNFWKTSQNQKIELIFMVFLERSQLRRKVTFLHVHFLLRWVFR